MDLVLGEFRLQDRYVKAVGKAAKYVTNLKQITLLKRSKKYNLRQTPTQKHKIYWVKQMI